jgi:Flp pilus assembly protein CpaB
MAAFGRPGRLRLGSAPPWWRGHRSTVIRWTSAFALAAASVALVSAASGRAEHTLAGYGRLRRVPVARRDLPPGHVLSDGDIDWRELPPAAVPSDVVAGSPVGHAVVDRLARGEVIGDLRVAPGGLSPLAATVARGQRALAVPLPAGGLHLVVGDRVDVIAPRRAAGDLIADAPAPVVAHAASVLAVGDAEVVLAVSDRDARDVADALAQGTPVLDLLGR